MSATSDKSARASALGIKDGNRSAPLLTEPGSFGSDSTELAEVLAPPAMTPTRPVDVPPPPHYADPNSWTPAFLQNFAPLLAIVA